MDVGDRIKQKRLELGWTLKDVASELGVKEATAQRYESGHIKTLKQETISKIADIFKVNPAWLMGWEESELPAEGTLYPKAQMLPILSKMCAGSHLLDDSNIIGYAPVDLTHPEEYFYLAIDNDSMINVGITVGALVLIHKQNSCENGQIIACHVNGEDATLKRFKQLGDTVILIPENASYEPIILKSRDFKSKNAVILGVAIRYITSTEL